MQLHSAPPHDFYLTLDADDYWEAEYEPETIVEQGYVRPLVLTSRDVYAVVRWNENPDEPVFDVTFPEHDLTETEESEAKQQLSRILGTDLDLRPLYEQASDDAVLGPLLSEHYGFKRLARANLWEECVDDFVRSRIRHRPTAKRMSQDVRRTFGSSFLVDGTTYYSYPRPEALVGVDPELFREFGISKRKGEYMVDLATAIANGEFDVAAHEALEPDEFYEQIQKVRGIGPSTAQGLMHFRNRTDCTFPSNRNRDGEEKGLRRWLIGAYGGTADEADEAEFLASISAWRNYEAMALRFLYIDYVLREKKRS